MCVRIHIHVYDMIWYGMIWYDLVWYDICNYNWLYIHILPTYFPRIHISIHTAHIHTSIHILHSIAVHVHDHYFTLPHIPLHYCTLNYTYTHIYIYNNHNCIYIWYHLIISPPPKSKTIDICKIIQHHTAKHTAISAKAIWAALPAALLRGVGDIRYVLL